MKKLFALVLAAMLLFSFAAVAEEARTEIEYDENLSFSLIVPDGYIEDDFVEEGIMTIVILHDDETKPNFVINIAPDDEFDEVVRLNDMSEEDVNHLIADLTEDLANPVSELRTTAAGTGVIVIDEQNAEYDVATFTTIYHGYVVTMYAGYNDGSTITEEDITLGMQIYSDLEFIHAK